MGNILISNVVFTFMAVFVCGGTLIYSFICRPIYADMVCFDERRLPESGEHFYCVYASRKDGHRYARSHEEIMARYDADMVMQEEMPSMNWPQMGRYMYTARIGSADEVEAFVRFVQE